MNDLDARLARGPLRTRSLWSAQSPERLARRILQRRRFFFALDAVAVCACVALVAILPVTRALLAPDPTLSALTVGGITGFSDGSIAELEGRDTTLAVEESAPGRVVVKLTGGARFKVVHDPARTFEVRASDVRVRVLGTTFSVQELPGGRTQVLVERGHVEVAWLGGATDLWSGEGGTYPPAAPEVDPEASNAVAPTAPVAPLTPSVTAAASAHGRGGDGWRDDARAGDYGRAWEELKAKGRDPVRDDAEDLMLAADVARLSAHPEDAVQPLRRVFERHARDRRAPVAAFTLGRVLLDDLDRPADAAAAFHKARVLWPAGPLAEDALAREADASDRAGRADAARGAAGDYVARYPQGRHAEAMRKILAR